jgi:hypothetical protein
MDDSFSSKLKRVHRGVREEAAGSTVRYCVLFCGRILHVLFGKTIVARGYYYLRYKTGNTLLYFRRDDLIVWYVLYWIVFCGMLVKIKLARIFSR